jgi:citrate synthase
MRKTMESPEGSLKIGSQAQRSSAISASNAETIVVRGRDLCGELVGAITFTDHIWLLITGVLPNAAQRRVLDATLVAIAEHGLVPSVAASRMTLAAAPEALQGAVAAGILGCGSVILGSAETAARLFADIVARKGAEGPEAAARAALGELRTARKPVPGYGHPLHKRQDPRVARLLAVATEAGVAGRHIEIASLVERLVPEIWGRPLAMNVSGAIAAVLLDAGYPLLAVKGVPILARTASLIAHLTEEQQRPIGFVIADEGASAIGYDGQKPDGFEPGES